MGKLNQFLTDLVRYPVIVIGAIVLLLTRLAGWFLLIAGLVFAMFWFSGDLPGLGAQILVTVAAGSALLAIANVCVPAARR